MTDPDPAAPDSVGSVAEEAFKLFRALSQPDVDDEHVAPHVCTTTWCPVCQVVGFVRDNPDALAQVSRSAAVFTRSVRDLIDTATAPREES